ELRQLAHRIITSRSRTSPSRMLKPRIIGCSRSMSETRTYHASGRNAWRTSVSEGYASVWVWEWKIPRTSHPLSSISFHTLSCSETDVRRSEEHTSELQSRSDLVCRLLLEKKKKSTMTIRM